MQGVPRFYATLKVWQLVDAKYWIIYGRTNKFQATTHHWTQGPIGYYREVGQETLGLLKRAMAEYLTWGISMGLAIA